MERTLRRRTLLAAVGGAAAGLAGCLGDGTDAEPDDGPTDTATPAGPPGPDLPAACPTTQGLDVEWPREVDADAAAEFVTAYANAYVREVVVGYEPESRVDEYGISVGRRGDPVPVGDGYEVFVSGSGGVYRPTLDLAARAADAPADADVVPAEDVDDDTLRGLLERAAAEGEADRHVEPPGAAVDRYIDLVAALSAEFDPPESPGDSGTAHFAVADADDRTTVELTVTATRFHGDYWVGGRYYVDERVVYRVDDEEADPRADGELLECRDPE